MTSFMFVNVNGVALPDKRDSFGQVEQFIENILIISNRWYGRKRRTNGQFSAFVVWHAGRGPTRPILVLRRLMCLQVISLY